MAEKTVEEELAKLKRRQDRNMRHAKAEGLLQGILSMLTPDDVVIDCGANMGVVTGPLAKAGATVHAFEPDPFAFQTLQKKFADVPNVILHNAAVGVTDGTIKLMRAANFDDNPRGASVKSTVISRGRKIDEDPENTIDVDLIDLTKFIAGLVHEHGELSFLKLDIEGAELELLEVLDANDQFEKIRLTVAETHEKKFKNLADRFLALRANISEKHPITKVNLDWI